LCPNCSSDRARYSRRHYEGLWFLLSRVRPVKCSDCGAYFPIARDGSIPRPQRDPVDLHIPFRPSELDVMADDLEEGVRGEPSGNPARFPRSRGGCPVCGCDDIRPSRLENDPSPVRRLDVKTTYRCVRCNASFRRTNPLRFLLFSLILLGVLAALSYLALVALSGRGLQNRSPMIKKDQIKEPPPPVFR